MALSWETLERSPLNNASDTNCMIGWYQFAVCSFSLSFDVQPRHV